jgi:SAM-dependent methyltransferase
MTSLPVAPASPKSASVKAVFEDSQRYLNRRLDITVRAEIVKSYASQVNFHSVLDIGCGDGSISVPLLNSRNRATLLDFSASMTSLARSRVPAELAGHVDVRNEDFMTASFSQRFDLIVCLGVLAHADSPDQLIGKIVSLLVPGGHLILEFTDAYNFLGRLGRIIRAVHELAAPPRFSVNLFSFDRVAQLVAAHDLRFVSQYRYALPPIPGLGTIKRDAFYRFVRIMYGECDDNRNTWLGNEYICMLTRGLGAPE